MRAFYLIFVLSTLSWNGVRAQKMTIEEYRLVTNFKIDNLDEDTYVKVNSEYVLDRYLMKPPYYIAGNSGSKNRVDLYKFIKRENLTDMGLLIVYTNKQTEKISTLCLPLRAENDVWAQYYDDLKYGGQEDPGMAFAIGSVLSKELSGFLGNGSSEVDYEIESSDYDICFPAGSSIAMADGTTKNIEALRKGDQIFGLNSSGNVVRSEVVLTETHSGSFPLVKTHVIPLELETTSSSFKGMLPLFELRATANHPVATGNSYSKIGDLEPGDLVLIEFNGKPVSGKVVYQSVSGHATKVYNLKTASGNFIVNNMVVSDK